MESEIQDIRSKNEKLKELKSNEKTLKEEAENKYKKVAEKKTELEREVRQMKSLQAEDEEAEKRLTEEKEVQEKVVDNLREELESVKLNVTTCQAELASEIAEKLLVPPAGAGRVPPRHLANPLGPGQLPDLNTDAVSVIKKETHGAGLTILDPAENNKAVLEPVKSPGAGLGISSSSKPQIKDDAGGGGGGGGVLPLPGDNLDNAEDDSQIVQHENGPEGKEEIQDDDQNPDGQIEETVDLDKQLYLVDKNQVDGENNEETIHKDEENTDDFGTSNEDVGEEKLEIFKESLNKEDEQLEPLIK